MTKVYGITGSIGMGKSTVADMFARLGGVPVFDSDAEVHQLLTQPEVIEEISAQFPGVVVDGVVDRARLGAAVFENPGAKAELEALLHPRVRTRQDKFVEKAKARGAPFVLLDIPLLFETGAEARLDGVILVSAPAEVQKKRVLVRPGMDIQKFEAILKSQMPDDEKRTRADIIIENSDSLSDTERQVAEILKTMDHSQ